MTTPKEELIQAIEQSPDEVVNQLLEILRGWQHLPVVEQPIQEEEVNPETFTRLHRKQGVLVIETEQMAGFDINAFIGEMREERIQDQIGQGGL
jgi:hypothetical protein